MRLIALNCAVVVVALQCANCASKAGAYPRCFGCGLFYADRSTSLPLLVFVDKALGVPQLLLGLLYVVLITLALLLNEVFVAVTNLLIL